MFQSSFTRKRSVAAGSLAVGIAITISSFAAVRAEHASPDKAPKTVFTCRKGTACLTGRSTGANTAGVEGTSKNANGVTGTTTSTDGDSAVAGISLGTTGHANGTYGHSSNGPGVFGSSSAEQGVYGMSSAMAGVYGTATSGYGVEGHSTANGSAGVAGFQANTTSDPGWAIFGESADATQRYATLTIVGASSKTFPFQAYNSSTDQECLMDYDANFTCDGTIQGSALRTRHLSITGQHVLAYASESASSTIDDVGTARLVAGVASVALDRAFASTIDRNGAYRVFVTPRGDTHGLYVSTTTAAGFVVREAQGGRSTVSFDYRIVARPLDAKNDRLPLAPAIPLRRPSPSMTHLVH